MGAHASFTMSDETLAACAEAAAAGRCGRAHPRGRGRRRPAGRAGRPRAQRGGTAARGGRGHRRCPARALRARRLPGASDPARLRRDDRAQRPQQHEQRRRPQPGDYRGDHSLPRCGGGGSRWAPTGSTATCSPNRRRLLPVPGRRASARYRRWPLGRLAAGVRAGRPGVRRAAARPHRGRARPPTSPCSTTPPRPPLSAGNARGTLDLRPVAEARQGRDGGGRAGHRRPPLDAGGRGAARRRGGHRGRPAVGTACRTFRRTISPPWGARLDEVYVRGPDGPLPAGQAPRQGRHGLCPVRRIEGASRRYGRQRAGWSGRPRCRWRRTPR